MRIGLRCLLLLFLFSLVPTLGAVRAQEPKVEAGKLVHELTAREVARYEFLGNDGKTGFERVPRSLLRWSNTIDNLAYGDTFVWTDRGCAKAIISIFALGPPRNSVAAECQSLTDVPFEMHRDGTVVWRPRAAGVSFQPVDDVPPPAVAATSRLVQMRAIARRFRADFAKYQSPDDYTQLRLLPKPLYRYDSQDEAIIDGAVFAFVDATDPELLLVIEARREDDQVSWVYAPARSRHDHIRLYSKDKMIWEAPRLAPPWSNIRDPSRPYFNLRVEKLLPPEEWQRIGEAFAKE